MEKREGKIENKNRGKILENDSQQTSYKIISQSFLFESITSNDNLIYDDTGTNMQDDDVFLDKEVPQELDESSFIREKENKDKTSSLSKPRRKSDVIDSIGDNYESLKVASDAQDIHPYYSRHRANSDLGYGEGPGSPLIATAVAFSFPSSELYNLKDRRKLDVIDARPFNAVQSQNAAVLEARMPVERDAENYNMSHPRRGRAIIINNDMFDNNFVTPRTGSHVDVLKLENVFSDLEFEVTVFDNKTFQEIKKLIYEVSQEDHNDADCLVVAVLTHGMDNGLLYARDSLYPVESLWFPFTADKCLTLAGKPKIFFIQACRGDKLDPGVTLVSRKDSVSETDTGAAAYKIPSHSDFLIAYSSMHGFYSWRNTEDGTWFIQSLVQELKDNASKLNFLLLLTRVSRRVALLYSSNNEDMPWLHDQKQVPTFHSTLIRDLIFEPKNSRMEN